MCLCVCAAMWRVLAFTAGRHARHQAAHIVKSQTTTTTLHNGDECGKCADKQAAGGGREGADEQWGEVAISSG